MSVTMLKNSTETVLAEQFALALPGLPGNESMRERRKSAFAHFDAVGLPSRRVEAWHYTDLRTRMREAALPVLSLQERDKTAWGTQVDPLALAVPKIISFVNGNQLNEPEMPAGVTCISMRAALIANHPLLARLGEALEGIKDPVVALNDAFFAYGVIVHVAAGAKVTEPIFMSGHYSMSGPRSSNTRALIVLEKDAELSFVSDHLGPDGIAYQTNLVGEFLLADGAKVEMIRYEAAGNEAQAITTLAISMGKNCEFNTTSLTTGGNLSRYSIFARCIGENSKLGIRGVSLLKGQQHADTTLVVDHASPGCESRELFRNVVDGSATGVFQGKIIVRQAAQQTDGRMASNALLLSDDATMNNKPELEIFADDVQCAHGATCGALDENLLFYLQARGLPKKEAEALMIQAFCGEVFEFVSNEPVRDVLNGLVEDWLKARAG